MADGQGLVVQQPQDQLGQLAAQVGGFAAYPAIQRSQMVADAIRQMQANPPTLRTPGSLWSNLAANALLQYARNRNFNKELQAVQSGVSSYAQAGAQGLNGPAGAPGPTPSAAAAPAPAPAPAAASPPAGPQNSGPDLAMAVQMAAGHGPPPPAPAQGAPQTGDAFNKFLGFWVPHEGAPGHRDVDGGTDYYGLDTASNPDLKANPPRSLQEAVPYLEQRVWDASGAPQIAQSNPALAVVHADTFGMSNHIANVALQASGGDVGKYIAAREAGLQALVAANPAKFGPVAHGWANRSRDLAAYASQISGPGAPAQGQPGLPQGSYQVASNGPTPPPPSGQAQGQPQDQPQPQPGQGAPTPLQMAIAAQGATPGERAIIQQGLQAPPGSALYMQAVAKEYEIRDRAAQMPKLPDGQVWGPDGYAHPAAGGWIDVPGGPPNAVEQRNQGTGEVAFRSNPAYGPVAGGTMFGGSSGQSQPNGQPGAPSGPPRVEPIPGAGLRTLTTPQDRQQYGINPLDHATYAVGPDGKVVQTAVAPVPLTELNQRQSAFTSSDQYKDYMQVRTSINGLTNAIQSAGGNSNILGATALTTVMQSWGLQNPRAASVDQIEQASGLSSKAATALLQALHSGGMPMTDVMNILREAEAQGVARENALTDYVKGDVNAVRARDPSLAGALGETIPPLPQMPTFGQPGAPRAGAPQMDTPPPVNQRTIGMTLRGRNGLVRWTGQGWVAAQ